MLIVGTDVVRVEMDLIGGRLTCPSCAAELRPWGHGAEREVRQLEETERRRFRRSICSVCRATHVLVPEDTLVRRSRRSDHAARARRSQSSTGASPSSWSRAGPRWPSRARPTRPARSSTLRCLAMAGCVSEEASASSTTPASPC